MSQLLDAIKDERRHTKRQYVLNLVLAGALGIALLGWKSSARDFTLHLPPDLRSGATIDMAETPSVPAHTVYLFSFYIWQQINRWQTDGEKDYGQQIFRLQNYITPACREQLVADQNARAKTSELYHRTRSVSEIAGLGFRDERVRVLSPNTWQVLLDTQLVETQNGTPLKDVYIRYPMRVVRFDIDREKNPFGLAIDCFGDQRPARLDTHAVELAIASQAIASVKPEVPLPVSPLAVGSPDEQAPSAPTAPAPAPASTPAPTPGSAPMPHAR